MLYKVISFLRATCGMILGILLASFQLPAQGQTNVNVRIMAANLNGDSQTYEPFAIRIFQGLQPDVVAIQEFKYNGNTPADIRSLVDTAFGTNFYYYREPFTGNGDLPNGVISRYPIINSGSWIDNSVGNRGFAWAQIDLPGTNDLYVVSVHLLTSSAGDRATEATQLKSLIQSNFPTNAWIVLAGDFNTDGRTESAMTTFGTFLSDYPIPVDNNGNSNTSVNRNHSHDYVLPSFSLTNIETASVFPSHSFPNGLVFDSGVYTPLTDVSPVLIGDSANAQHMAVIKDFFVIGALDTNAPTIIKQPTNQTVPVSSNVVFTVTATGAAPLSYQWYFNTNNPIPGASANILTLNNAQLTNTGTYSVIITNAMGSLTSSVVTLTVTNIAPIITQQPQNQSVFLGGNATFTVGVAGTQPLSYQWYFNTNTVVTGATNSVLNITSAQPTNAGSYSVVITNSEGSTTSAVAILRITTSSSLNVIAQWNFNSTPPDGATTTGTTAPSSGSGTASLIGGATATFATGDPSIDPVGSTDNSGWNTSGYPPQGTGNKTRGPQFSVSTVGWQNIVIAWTSQCSNAGSKYARLQYTINGTDFIDFPTAVTNAASYVAKTNNLGAFSDVNNNPNFAVRIVAEFEQTAISNSNPNYVPVNAANYAATGTMRYDMLTILGSPIAANPAPPVLTSSGIVSGNQFQLMVAGATGSNYIIQVSTNLTASNWISIFTNAAPFTFTDSNAPNFPQGFYRAVALP